MSFKEDIKDKLKMFKSKKFKNKEAWLEAMLTKCRDNYKQKELIVHQLAKENRKLKLKIIELEEELKKK